jgi:AcrR family transcriptional regulator
VLSAALSLLTERGVAGTTIEAVARRSGVAKTTIYRHWPGQPALVFDAFDGALRAPADPDTGELRDDLVALLGGLADALSHSPAAALMPALLDAAEREPAFAELHHRLASYRHAPALAAIRRGITRGELPATSDPVELLDLLTGPLFYRRMFSRRLPDRQFAEHIVDHVLAGAARLQSPHH